MAADAIMLWRSLIVGGKVRTMGGNPTKTVAVIRFEATDGRPIAVYCNYAVHAVLNGQLDQVSGDKGSIFYGTDRTFGR